MIAAIGLIGAGSMGIQLAQCWRKKGYTVIAYDPNAEAKNHLKVRNCIVFPNIPELTEAVPVIWLMVAPGIVDTVLKEMTPHLRPGTIVIDGGDSNFNDSIRRAAELKKIGVSFLDCGISGGVNEQGFSLMVGGEEAAYEQAKQFFETLAGPLVKDEHGCFDVACALLGPSGAGHYAKMVHDSIERALMEAYGEGFKLIREDTFKELDLQEISRVWQAAAIRSELLNRAHDILACDQKLKFWYPAKID